MVPEFLVETDVLLSTAPRGDGSDAAKRLSVEITLRHELGHVLGLAHPPSTRPVLMNSQVQHVAPDELVALERLYR
jgi:predicted Zn-dependent protease